MLALKAWTNDVRGWLRDDVEVTAVYTRASFGQGKNYALRPVVQCLCFSLPSVSWVISDNGKASSMSQYKRCVLSTERK